MRRAANRDFFAQIERAWQQMWMEAERGQHFLELGLKPPVALHVVLGEVEDDPAVPVVHDPVVGIGEIFRGQPEIHRMVAHEVERYFRRESGPPPRFGRYRLAMRFAEHLHMAQRVGKAGGAEIEVVQGQCLLKFCRVGLARDRHEGRIVVSHVVPADDARAVGEPVRMLVASGAQQKESRIQGSACDDDDISRVRLLDAFVIDTNRADAAAGGLRLQTLDKCIGDECDIRVLEHRLDADALCIRLAIDQARITVESIAPDASAGGALRLAVLFVEQHAERQRKWMMALPLQGVMEFLDARLVRDRRAGIRPACRRVSRVDPMLAMYLVELLSFAIVRLKILVGERPSRGRPAMMFDLAEILLAQTKQRGAVHLGIAAHPIVDPRMERAAIPVVPGLLRLIPCIGEDGGGIPIFSFTWQKVTAFEEQNSLAARRKPMGEGTSSCTRADDDDVITLAGHVEPLSLTDHPPVENPGNRVMPPSTNSVAPTRLTCEVVAGNPCGSPSIKRGFN